MVAPRTEREPPSEGVLARSPSIFTSIFTCGLEKRQRQIHSNYLLNSQLETFLFIPMWFSLREQILFLTEMNFETHTCRNSLICIVLFYSSTLQTSISLLKIMNKTCYNLFLFICFIPSIQIFKSEWTFSNSRVD